MVFVDNYDKHTVNTRDELSGVDVMTLPEAQEASEQWQSVTNYYTDLYFIHQEKSATLTHISTWVEMMLGLCLSPKRHQSKM